MGDRVQIGGVSLSSPDRVIYPEDGITKLDLARYYERIANQIVEEVRGRPLTLVQCPRDIVDGCTYMRHRRVWGPSALRRVTIPEKKKDGEYLIADDLAGVIALVQLNILEIHTWNTRYEHLETPDRLIFDLDPGSQIKWEAVVETAHLVRTALRRIGFEGFVKTTGGKGLHVVVPLLPDTNWDDSFAFVRAFTAVLVERQPKLLTMSVANRSQRENRILIDYLRNSRANTAVAAYSTRARSHAPISLPVTWDELETIRAAQPTIRSSVRRLRRHVWIGYEAAAVSIKASLRHVKKTA
jgi:bifunctional non-homologous end joining protein LigD